MSKQKTIYLVVYVFDSMIESIDHFNNKRAAVECFKREALNIRPNINDDNLKEAIENEVLIEDIESLTLVKLNI